MEMRNKSVYSSQQLRGSALERGSRMKALYDSVINSPSQFGVKTLSDSAEMRKLKYMEKNVRQKQNAAVERIVAHGVPNVPASLFPDSGAT